MSHFAPKSLLFYAVAIGSVVTLFQVVSSYGERTLKAPPNVNGRYISTTAPPGCPNDRLVLEIQQSGIYLNGALRLQAAQSAANDESHLSLKGEWQQGQVSLSGETNALATCAFNAQSAAPPAVQSADEMAMAMLQGQLTDPSKGLFVGQLTLEGLSLGNGTQPWQFQAQRQAEPKAGAMEH